MKNLFLMLIAVLSVSLISCQKENPQPNEPIDMSFTPTEKTFKIAAGDVGFNDCNDVSFSITSETELNVFSQQYGSCGMQIINNGQSATVKVDSIYTLHITESSGPGNVSYQEAFDFKIDANGEFIFVNQTAGSPYATYFPEYNLYSINI
jgi:hypothetical protein